MKVADFQSSSSKTGPALNISHGVTLTEVKAATPRKDFGCLFSSGFVNSCHRFAEENAPFASHHKPPFFFSFF